MNIPPNTANLPLATVVNQATETLRRENNQREVISQVAATNSSAAEKGVASDKDRGRSPAQTNQHVDFASLQKVAEQKANKAIMIVALKIPVIVPPKIIMTKHNS